MNESADVWFDRTRLKAKLTYWRSLALIVVAASVVFVGFQSAPRSVGGNVIARIVVEDVITDDAKRDALLNDLEHNPHVKAVMVRFDSPGGTTVGGEELYVRLQKISKKKPVVSVMRTVCASACYMAALGTDYIMARETSITGSIGVLMQSVEVSELADRLGIHPITITGGAFKDTPSMFKKPTEADLDAVRPMVNDTHAYFIHLVKINRKIEGEALASATNGRVFIGAQAVKLKLIDAIGGEDEALEWLEKTKKIRGKVQDFSYKDELSELKKWLETKTLFKFMNQIPAPLDGLVSIWHLGKH